MRYVQHDTFSDSRERLVLATLHILAIVDGLIGLLSLTLLTSDFHGSVLFSDWAQTPVTNSSGIDEFCARHP